MVDSKNTSGNMSTYYYTDILCYASTNLFIIIGGIFCLRGDLWTWTGFCLSLVLFGFFDKFPNDLANAYVNRPSMSLSNFILYLTFPLLFVYTATTFYITGASCKLSLYQLLQVNYFRNTSYTETLADLGAFTSLGMYYGMIGGTVGHELVHRVSSKRDQFIGCLLLAPIWETGIRIEHVYGHHRNVATSKDTATAFRGESFYKFFIRSTVSQFIGAHHLEKHRLLRKGLRKSIIKNKFYQGQFMSFCYSVILIIFFGFFEGLLLSLYILIVGKIYVRLTDYISHYGLVRLRGDPISERHSWVCYNTMSNYIFYHLTLHADHHLNGTAPFWELDKTLMKSPQLPFGIVSTGLIALVPKLWFKKIRPSLSNWDNRFASIKEIDYLKAHNLYMGDTK
jgi:hypothetical protein